jgi:hypothetical protein
MVSSLAQPRHAEQHLFIKWHAWHVPAHLGLGDDTGHAMPPDEYAARAVAAFCEAVLRHAGIGRSAFVEYAALPDAVLSRLLPFFGVRADDAELARMRDAAAVDTKNVTAGSRARAEHDDPSGEIEQLAAPGWTRRTRRSAPRRAAKRLRRPAARAA